MKILCMKYSRHWIAIWGLTSAQIKKLKKTDLNLDLFSSTFFIQAPLRPQIVIQRRVIISSVYFSRFGTLQIIIFENKSRGLAPKPCQDLVQTCLNITIHIPDIFQFYSGQAWSDLTWPGLAWLDLAWPGMTWPGQTWPDLRALTDT